MVVVNLPGFFGGLEINFVAVATAGYLNQRTYNGIRHATTPVGFPHINIHQITAKARGIVGIGEFLVNTYATATGLRAIICRFTKTRKTGRAYDDENNYGYWP